MVFMASLTTRQLTEDEYLCIERAAFEKNEFHNGQMFAMAGGSRNHSFLTSSISSLLYQQKPPGCRVFSSDLRIHAASKTYSYADSGVICGVPQFSSEEQDNLINPLLLVEVLSPSTEDYDRGKKFELYRTIESFCEYLIIHQDKPHVEHYSRQDDKSWLLREHSGDDATVSIPRLGAQFLLADLYSSAVFPL
jgi:Uma2 family endonuclease